MSTSDFTSIKNVQFHTAYLLIHILVATLLRNWYCAHQAPKDFRSGAAHIKARVKNQHILTILGVL
jgi:hypothetical protein